MVFDKDAQVLVDSFISDLAPRTKEIIVKRYGLDGEKPRTLEEIGKTYGITRERVRQIQASAVKEFQKKDDLSTLKPVEEMIEKILKEHGHIVRHDQILDEFANRSTTIVNPYVVEFVLELSNKFVYHAETEKTHRAWATKQGNVDVPTQVIEAFMESLRDAGKPMPHQATVKCVLDHEVAETHCDVIADGEVVATYLALSKQVRQNPFGEWGFVTWTEINPKGVKDKAFVVLKRAGEPMHFSEITEAINASGFATRPAIPQTVHNELIKDERFVLVGRGMYALKEWGFEPGTVADVAARVLKAHGGTMKREDLLKEVLKQRFVKKNTVMLALQNKDRFVKGDDGTYALVS